ncbi:AraC family transcriptional regulator [Gallaecimonas mangrovi]|uniref:AraC family transcriptional regulator n=1 Tax=Gallaecimonas mangrovi TaxID=2291597 RepID=UPI000E1FC8D5|nr:AraC family transcriptional regulator [Gallaecimonas mangrovi]
MTTTAQLARLIDRHCQGEGITQTAVSRLKLMRSFSPTEAIPWSYSPSLCLVSQGAKGCVIGNQQWIYNAERYLVVSVDLPVMSQIISASENAPFLSLHLSFDPGMVARFLALPASSSDHGPLLATNATDQALVDACIRLVSLLDNPDDIAYLAPLIEQEIIYRLVKNGAAPVLSHIVKEQGSAISRAVTWIKANYQQAFSIQTLAQQVGLSSSVLHERFKQATALSPMQYRTHIRLHEARRMMVFENVDAAAAAYRVGYGTPAQFSREYRRLFGLPPASDAAALRSSNRPGIGPAVAGGVRLENLA